MVMRTSWRLRVPRHRSVGCPQKQPPFENRGAGTSHKLMGKRRGGGNPPWWDGEGIAQKQSFDLGRNLLLNRHFGLTRQVGPGKLPFQLTNDFLEFPEDGRPGDLEFLGHLAPV